jgi:hypothetical protein
MPFQIDPVAQQIAITRYVLPPCLHVPIAAVDEAAIETYVGTIEKTLTRRTHRKALLVRAREPPPIDARLPIWDFPASEIFHRRLQVWVHIESERYRPAYRKAFPNEAIEGKIISHTMNRETAYHKGFDYVRITPTSGAANTSSSMSEQWAKQLQAKPSRRLANQNQVGFIQYADLTDLMLMLDIKLGGGIMEVVNEGQKLVRPR